MKLKLTLIATCICIILSGMYVDEEIYMFLILAIPLTTVVIIDDMIY